MTIAEREKKLERTRQQWRSTFTRIRRLMTAERKWAARVARQEAALTAERASVKVNGRMFRS